MRITLLGTGTSTGVPIIGCPCRVCTSADPRDNRLRCSCLVEVDGLHLVIDTGPDFRQQAMRVGLRTLDAVLYTHHHFDHVVGMEDLRPFLYDNRRPVPCYAHPETAQVLRAMFGYIFADGSYPGSVQMTMHAVEAPFAVRSRYTPDDEPGPTVLVEPLAVFHGTLPIYGYRIGSFAYLTDTSHIPEATFDRLQGLDVLILDALRHDPHPTHFTLTEAARTAQRIGAKQTYFIHMTHNVLHAEEDASLPDGIHLGYDGLVLEIDG